MRYDVLYLCDQKKVCSISDACGQRDGCIYTIDPKHAKNGPATDQKDLNDRFEHIKMGAIEFWREKSKMSEIMIDTEWTFDNVPDRKKKKYRGKYLYIYSSAAKFFNDGVIDELNDRFNEEIGPLDDYDCPLYNNWMAVNMTKALAKSGVVRSDFFQFIFYDSDLVLNCATSDGVRIKMALVPGSEKILEEQDAKDNS